MTPDHLARHTEAVARALRRVHSWDGSFIVADAQLTDEEVNSLATAAIAAMFPAIEAAFKAGQEAERARIIASWCEAFNEVPYDNGCHAHTKDQDHDRD